jgi:hypothetical protein
MSILTNKMSNLTKYVKVVILSKLEEGWSDPGVLCIMKNLWCCNFLIFHTILINDVSNKIVLNGLQFELIQYLFLSSVFDT